VDVSYAVVAEFADDDVPTDQQLVVNNLLSRDEVVQVIWAKRSLPQPRPSRPRRVLVAMALLNHSATESVAREVSQLLEALELVQEVRVERPGPPQSPVRGIAVAPPTATRPPGSAD
jgi:hypothetical protein